MKRTLVSSLSNLIHQVAQVEVNTEDENAVGLQEADDRLQARLTGTLGVKPEKLSDQEGSGAKRPIATPARASDPFPKRFRKIPTRQDFLVASLHDNCCSCDCSSYVVLGCL